MSVYQHQVPVTNAARRTAAYRQVIPDILAHADALNVNVTKIEVVAGNFVQFTTSAQLSAEQLAHLNLDVITP